MSGILASLALLVTGHAAVALQPESAEPVEIPGRCEYSDRLAPLLEQNHVFIECDRLIMRRVAGQSELVFAFPARLRSIEVRGRFEQGGRFSATAVRLRSQREWDEAEGTCEFGQPGNGQGVITCLIKSGARFFVVNFEPED